MTSTDALNISTEPIAGSFARTALRVFNISSAELLTRRMLKGTDNSTVAATSQEDADDGLDPSLVSSLIMIGAGVGLVLMAYLVRVLRILRLRLRKPRISLMNTKKYRREAKMREDARPFDDGGDGIDDVLFASPPPPPPPDDTPSISEADDYFDIEHMGREREIREKQEEDARVLHLQLQEARLEYMVKLTEDTDEPSIEADDTNIKVDESKMVETDVEAGLCTEEECVVDLAEKGEPNQEMASSIIVENTENETGSISEIICDTKTERKQDVEVEPDVKDGMTDGKNECDVDATTKPDLPPDIAVVRDDNEVLDIKDNPESGTNVVINSKAEVNSQSVVPSNDVPAISSAARARVVKYQNLTSLDVLCELPSRVTRRPVSSHETVFFDAVSAHSDATSRQYNSRSDRYRDDWTIASCDISETLSDEIGIITEKDDLELFRLKLAEKNAVREIECAKGSKMIKFLEDASTTAYYEGKNNLYDASGDESNVPSTISCDAEDGIYNDSLTEGTGVMSPFYGSAWQGFAHNLDLPEPSQDAHGMEDIESESAVFYQDANSRRRIKVKPAKTTNESTRSTTVEAVVSPPTMPTDTFSVNVSVIDDTL